MANKLRSNARFFAVRDLTRIEKESSYSNKVVDQTVARGQLSKLDANLHTTLVYGTIQNKITLDFFLQPFLKKTNKLDLWVKQILRISVYQMVYLSRIPKHAIFNESIEIAKEMGHNGTRKFVTGVLHAIERQGLPKFDEIEDQVKRFSIEYSMPVWLVQQLISELGSQKTESLLAATLQAPAQSVRLNTTLSDPSDVQNILKHEGYQVKPSVVTPLAFRIAGGFPPSSQAYSDGKITVQDESAVLSAESMQIQDTDKVLDVCAAPGGKTTQIAQALGNDGHVDALDIHPKKLKLIQKNVLRMHLNDRVSTHALDARKCGQVFGPASFDKILVDAPCSGLGLIRRKPEVKYDKSAEDSKKLAHVQLAILNAAAPLVKKGGSLTYSTCTILNQENQQVIDNFLEENANFYQVKTWTSYGLKDDRETLSLTIYPDDFESDGFFIATLFKKNEV